MSRTGSFLLGMLAAGGLAAGAWQFGGDVVRMPVRAALCDCAGPLAVAQVTLASYRQEDKLVVHSETFNSRVVSRTQLLDLPAWVPEWFLAGQKTFLIPATVGYAVPLSEMADTDLSWDEEARTLTVRRPQVLPQAPQPEMRAVGVTVRGELVILLRDAQAQMDQKLLAEGMAAVSREARKAEAMGRAERDADIVLARLFERPLRAAGYPEARVIVTRRAG